MSTTTLQKTSIKITKFSDKELMGRVKQFIERGAFNCQQIQISASLIQDSVTVKGVEIFEDDRIKRIIEEDCQLLTQVGITSDTGATVSVQRKPDDWLDHVAVNPGTTSDLRQYLKVIRAAKECFVEIQPKHELMKFLDEDGKKHFQARELALAKQQDTLDRFTSQTQDFFGRLTEDFQQKHKELEADFSSRRQQADAERQEGLKKLLEREQELEKQKKEIDVRESKVVRREIHRRLLEKFDKRAKSFELTPGVWWKRLGVHLLYGALCLVFGGLAVYYLVSEIGKTDVVVIVRQLLFSVLFAMFIGFWIKWQNRWSQAHADEEFKLKRLEIDFERASWVFEMALDWKASVGARTPEYLVQLMSRNLFGNEKAKEEAMTAADVIASAILGTAGSIKLNVGGNEILLDKKSIESLKRKRVGDSQD